MFSRYYTIRPLVLALLLLIPAPSATAQTCSDPGAYCEGWSRDSTRHEVSLTRTTKCGLTQCLATFNTTPITALPSIRIGDLNHVVLGFSVSDACVPECPNSVMEPCYNLGVSYRRKVTSGTESVTGVADCDLSDPGTTVSSGATFSGDYASGGTESVTISNIVYGVLPPPDNCGDVPVSLDMTATGPNLAVQSHFTFQWSGYTVTGYTEARTYITQPPPNSVSISVSNIDYGAGTYSASAPGADVPTRGGTWGQLKLRYR